MNKNNLVHRDLAHIWHPYTQMKDCEDLPPIPVKKARGIKLYDYDGKFYYDTISSWWCNVHGHNHPRINAAIRKQLSAFAHVMFAGFTHEPAVLLAEELARVAPQRLRRIFFSDNGSTAVEVALKMSFQYWRNSGARGKTKFVSLDMGYHGDTVGSMSVSGVDMYNEVFAPLFFASYKVPSPYCYRCPAGKLRETCRLECAQSLENLLEKKSHEIAGIILEPMMMGAGGIIVYPKEYLVKAAQLARKFGVHLILDEVATGFGRTGKMFASEYAGDVADFICISKGITSGYLPLAATLTTEKIYGAFYGAYLGGKTFFHGHTYTANPLACAAAVASLKLFRENDLLRKVQRVIPVFHQRLEEFRGFENVGDIRRIGMVGALELVKDRAAKEPFPSQERVGRKVYRQGLKHGLVLRPLGNVIYFFLPLCTTRTQVDDILSRAQDALREVFF